MDDEYAPPRDLDLAPPDAAPSARHADRPRTCAFFHDVPMHAAADGAGFVLAACAATHARRDALRALGGAWRFAATDRGRVLGWAFDDASVDAVLAVLAAPPP